MKITYDKSTDAIYIYLTPDGHEIKGAVKKTMGDWPAHIDYDKDGHPFGIEILDASAVVNLSYLRNLEFEEIDEI